jgi:lipid-A-disaccharide synthase
MTDTRNPPLVFLIAGEPSGDAIGARLMAALRKRHGPDIRFAGLGGEAMIAEGLDSLFPISDISIMGLLEILPRLSLVLRRIRETVAAIRDLKPDIVVTIDSPGFCFRVWRKLGAAAPPLMHYVAPTVWAWRPERAKKFADAIQHLLALLPFEPPYFEAVGLPCTFVGHPVLESGANKGDGAAFRARHRIPDDAKVLGVLPGSRRGEVSRLLAPFGASVRRLAQMHPGLRVIVPTMPSVADLVYSVVDDWRAEVVVVPDMDEKYDAMAACDAALAASGTVALELAMARVPMVIGYRLNVLTGLVVRRLVRVKYVCLINLLIDREAVPELLLGDCKEERITPAVDRLLSDSEARKSQVASSAEAIAMLDAGGVVPSDRAAGAVLDLISDKETKNV